MTKTTLLLLTGIAALLAALTVGPALAYGPISTRTAHIPTHTPTPDYTLRLTEFPAVEPEGCWRPPDDYTRVWVGNAQLNARTLAMLDHAQALYEEQGGTVVDFRQAITQGSYNPGGVSASFGTHDAGGAVDLSVRSRADWSVLEDEIDPMLRALRAAGFAAWLRDTSELYPDSPIHIHAIAIGDAEQSEIARAQIDGTFGYLRGFNGLPQADATPIPDRYGGPIICDWMRAMGFDDLRGEPVPVPTPGGTAVPGGQ